MRAGATVKFYNTPEDVLTAVIETLDAPRLWALQWRLAESAPESALLTSFRLEPENGGRRVTVREAGSEQSLKELAALLERQGAPQ